MGPQNDYQFVLELFKPGPQSVGRALITVDWEPAIQCAEFEAMREGRLPPIYGVTQCGLEPVWNEDVGEPLVAGFRFAFKSTSLAVAEHERALCSKVFGTNYFADAAATAAAEFKQRGLVEEDENMSYQLLAFAKETDQSEQQPALTFETEDLVQALALGASSLPRARADAEATGETAEELMPAFVPASVLAEIAELSRKTEAKETGGILIGHLHRDENEEEIFATITTQLPAQHTEAELMKLTFTSETWTEVRNAIALRRRNEIMLGWWHSHPARAWCKDCSEESQRECRYARGFFSAHDRALHRTMFPRAYSLALVVNDVGFAPASFSLFGWKDGAIAERDFYVSRDGDSS
jgi:hypothetical protein